MKKVDNFIPLVSEGSGEVKWDRLKNKKAETVFTRDGRWNQKLWEGSS